MLEENTQKEKVVLHNWAWNNDKRKDAENNMVIKKDKTKKIVASKVLKH